MKNDKQKLEVFLKCESKSRELLAQMEVLHQMEEPGCLNQEMRQRLELCGAKIGEERKIVCYGEDDIITNYHVGKILDLREELIALIAEITKK